jgi:hypothetical protein
MHHIIKIMNLRTLSVCKFGLFTLLITSAWAEKQFSDDELLFFGSDLAKAPVETIAPPAAAPPPAATAGAFLKDTSESLDLLLLEAPSKSSASGIIANFSIKAEQAGTSLDPDLSFPNSGQFFSNGMLHGIVAIRGQINPFPAGVKARYECDSTYQTHERGSATLAGCVLLHHVMTGNALDTQVILCGGIGPNAAVAPILAIGTRLRTTDPGAGRLIGVPLLNEPEVRDLALMGEPEHLLRWEVVGLVTLEDALKLASATKPPALAKAHELFLSIRQAAATTPLSTLLKNVKVQQRLGEIAQLTPNHLSAKLLLQFATGKLPGKMTLLTSQQAILRAAQPFWESIRKNDPVQIRKVSTTSGNVLNLMQPKVHPTVERYLVATRAYMRAYNNYLELNPSKQFDAMRTKAWEGIEKLEADVKAEKAKLD